MAHRKTNSYCVYKHTTPPGKVYIGITMQDPRRRWRNGEGYKPPNGETTPFYSAIKKYGWDNIEHEIVAEGLSREDACKLEINLIKELKTQRPEYGYNVLKGGDVPLADCPETVKNKMRNSAYTKWTRADYIENHTGDNHWTRKIGHSSKAVEAMRQANIGKKRTPEQVEFLREKARKQKRLRGKDNRKSIPILCYSKEGDFLYKFYGALEAERETGVCFQNIFKVCNGERKTAGGFIWRYEKERTVNNGK